MLQSAVKPTVDLDSVFSLQTPDRIRITLKCSAHVPSNLMKSLMVSLLITTSAFCASGANVAPVIVQFTNPAKFTDFRIRGRDVNYTAGVFASSVTAELTPVMKQKYPNGSLLLRFTDIDLAGRYAGGTRVILEAHPARMNFEFSLSDSNGKSLARGSSRLVDSSNINSRFRDPRRSQVFYYERRLLNRWLRTLSPAR
jgi:hypothetical protein